MTTTRAQRRSVRQLVRQFLEVVYSVAFGAVAIAAVVAVGTLFMFLAIHTSFLKFLEVLAVLAGCWMWGHFIRKGLL